MTNMFRLICSRNRKRRFLTLILTLGIWVIIVYTLYQFLPSIDVPSRFLLQDRLDPLPRDMLSEPDSITVRMDLDPSVDKRTMPSEDDIIYDIQQRMPNWPIVYWNKNKNKTMGYNNTCARFPSMYDLQFNNIYWQTLTTSNGTFQLFGAYLDTRRRNSLGTTVRILGMIDRIEPRVTTYCQFWFDGKKDPVLEKSFEYNYIWRKAWGNITQGTYQPYLIACIIPPKYKHLIPQSISLVEQQCDNATNNLRIIYEKPLEKKDFAVCVKALDFLHTDLSLRLVEWIELLSLLGVDKIFFYELAIHPNISKVLKHYEQEGKVHVTPINLAGGLPNAVLFQHLYLTNKTRRKRQNELISYNDCFYKHMHEYKYIVLLDIDEVIIPLKGTTWKGLIEKLLPKALKRFKREADSYDVRNVYFLDDLHDHGWFNEIPRYMHMLQHVYRTKNFTEEGTNMKCFYNTEKVLTLHNHFPLSCFGSPCTKFQISTRDAQLHHYRADCAIDLVNSCKEIKKSTIMDTTIWKFKEPLIARVFTTLRTLGFFPISQTSNNSNKS